MELQTEQTLSRNYPSMSKQMKKRFQGGGSMMNFDLNTEQLMLRDMVRSFAEEVVAPGADERDRTKAFPTDIFEKMADLSLMGLPFPEEYGGAGADSISFAIVVEELSRVCASARYHLLRSYFLGWCAARHVRERAAKAGVPDKNMQR